MRYTQIIIMSVLKSRGSYTSIASIGALVKILKYICSFQREDQTRKEDRNAAGNMLLEEMLRLTQSCRY